jgi:hypothetical protein
VSYITGDAPVDLRTGAPRRDGQQRTAKVSLGLKERLPESRETD